MVDELQSPICLSAARSAGKNTVDAALSWENPEKTGLSSDESSHPVNFE
jgi:hypothetical protein